MLVRLLAVAAFLPLASAPLVAQGDSLAVLSGRVVDETGVGIAHAQVIVAGTAHATTADSTGRFALPALPPGTYDIRVSYVGFVRAAVEMVVLRGGQETRLDVVLESSQKPRTIRPVPGAPLGVHESGLRARWRGRAEQFGWPVLREAHPPERVKEFRLESGGGMLYGPWTTMRIVVGPDSTWGEVRETWRHDPAEPDRYQLRAAPWRTCHRPDSTTTLCVVSTTGTDWHALADSLEHVGLWERFVEEGVHHDVDYLSNQESLFAEAWASGRYRSADYYGPSSFTDPQTRALRAAWSILNRGIVYAPPIQPREK